MKNNKSVMQDISQIRAIVSEIETKSNKYSGSDMHRIISPLKIEL